MSQDDSSYGQQGLRDISSHEGGIDFYVRQQLAEVRTGVPVKIIAVHDGGVGAAPTVDVQPLVKQMDGTGVSSSHDTVYGLQVARNQGGNNAIINDPVVGDIGHVIVSDRDTSSVASNAGEANPGSYRRHNLADGVYHAAIINKATPTTYINLNGGNVVIVSAGTVSITDGNNNSIVTTSSKITVQHKNGGQFVADDKHVHMKFGTDNTIWIDKDGCYSSQIIQIAEDPYDHG